MRRIPVLPTLFVLAAVAVMIALGVWQLERATWKQRLLAEFAVNATLPPVDLDPLIARGTQDEVPLAFRRVLVTCASGDVQPRVRAGRNRRDVPGSVYLVPCRPAGEGGFARNLDVNVGWATQPDAVARLNLRRVAAGQLGWVEPGEPVTLTAAEPLAPLEATAPPSLDNVPNNHLLYAFQWFFFAAAALVIYAIALWRRLSPPRPGPTPRNR